MDWHVQYRVAGSELVAQYATPEMAIEAACVFLDNGDDVYGIGTGPLTDSIDRCKIAKIYALWEKPAARHGRRNSAAR